jgi:hypothetical protein
MLLLVLVLLLLFGGLGGGYYAHTAYRAWAECSDWCCSSSSSCGCSEAASAVFDDGNI